MSLASNPGTDELWPKASTASKASGSGRGTTPGRAQGLFGGGGRSGPVLGSSVARKPRMSHFREAEIVREEMQRERDEDNDRFADFDNDRRYAYGDGGDAA